MPEGLTTYHIKVELTYSVVCEQAEEAAELVRGSLQDLLNTHADDPDPEYLCRILEGVMEFTAPRIAAPAGLRLPVYPA